MFAKSINISGKYFIDSNKNGKYDDSEQVFKNKKIFAVANIGQPTVLYSTGQTTTDDSGNYSLTVNYIGSYSLSGDQELGYTYQPSKWIDLSGGETITYNLTAWPQ